MISNRYYIILIVLLCMLVSCTGTVSAAAYSGGSGTEGDPYLLSTDSDIDTLSTTTADWSKYFKLTQDITLVGNHTPIGDGSTLFTGDFDGNGYAVTNLTVYKNAAYAGFFGYTQTTANIHDLGVQTSSDGVVSTGFHVGALIGQNQGIVSNCSSTGIVTGSGSSEYVGGLIGSFITSGSVSNCSANVTVTGPSHHVGGLIGACDQPVSNCYATGNVIGGNLYTGGLMGRSWGAVSNCYATGNVTGPRYVGGLIGYKEAGTVSNSFATGTVDGALDSGAFIGLNVATVTNCYYSGSPASGAGTSTSYANFLSFAFVSGASGLNWNGSSDVITTEYDSSFIWKIDDGSTLPYFQYQSTPGILPVNSSVTGAWVYVNGTNQSVQTNTTLTLTPGWYNITVMKQYYETPANQTVNVAEGENLAIEFTLTLSPPIANFTANVTSGAVPLSVNFTDLSTNSPTSWLWDFGDGTNSTDQNPTHVYSSAGTYSVSLNATNTGGTNISTQSNYITAAIDPVANFTSNVTSGAVSLPVSFTDLTTNSPIGWAWYFGDEDLSEETWTEVNSSCGWSGRYSHGSVVLPDGSIVLMGGYNGAYLNDTWISTDDGVTWTEQNSNCEWLSRNYFGVVSLSDGTLVLMGGASTGGLCNDTWRSTDNGATWTLVNSSCGWSERYAHNSVVLSDDSIVLMGGRDGSNYLNDVWLSTDNGATWTEINPGADWSARHAQSSVALSDDSIVVTGGYNGAYLDDVWRSTDNGATWTEINSSPGWSAREIHSSVVLPDGSIVMIGGLDGSSINDMWMSTDNGTTWTEANSSCGWSARYAHSSVALPDGSIVVMGGYDGSNQNDVWSLNTAGSTEQNPTHTYTSAGTYQVTLQAFNPAGYDSIVQADYITAAVTPVANFSSNVTEGAIPLSVYFTDLSLNSPTSWFWDFGDGTNSTDQNPTHVYASAGIYTVSLNASNAGGSNVSTQLSYITAYTVPVANFSANVTEGAVQMSVNFTDLSANTPTSWSWDFGDGNTSTDQSPTHTYMSAGTYNVSLNATNLAGSDVTTRTSYISVYITPVANFSADVTSGTAPLSVSFTDLSNNTPTSWLWDFGDGSNSTSQNPTHSYTVAGSYNVTLNATNAAGSNVSTQTTYINVSAAPSTEESSNDGDGVRASVSQGQDPAIVVTSASSVIRVTSGSEVNYDFSDSGTPVIEVSFDSKNDQGLVVAKVQVLSSAPEGVPTPSGNSYKMMSIDVGSEGTISLDNADNVMIHFKVSKQWIEENNIDVSTVRMTRYHDDQWNDLSTYQENEDDEYVYFYAETPGFSIYSVVGDEVSDISGQVPVSVTLTEEETKILEEETKDTPGFTAITGIVLVSLAFLVSRKQKSE